jgi:hypothetical protein
MSAGVTGMIGVAKQVGASAPAMAWAFTISFMIGTLSTYLSIEHGIKNRIADAFIDGIWAILEYCLYAWLVYDKHPTMIGIIVSWVAGFLASLAGGIVGKVAGKFTGKIPKWAYKNYIDRMEREGTKINTRFAVEQLDKYTTNWKAWITGIEEGVSNIISADFSSGAQGTVQLTYRGLMTYIGDRLSNLSQPVAAARIYALRDEDVFNTSF